MKGVHSFITTLANIGKLIFYSIILAAIAPVFMLIDGSEVLLHNTLDRLRGSNRHRDNE